MIKSSAFRTRLKLTKSKHSFGPIFDVGPLPIEAPQAWRWLPWPVDVFLQPCCTVSSGSGLSTMSGHSDSTTLSLIFLLVLAATVSMCAVGIRLLVVLQSEGGSTAVAPFLNLSICSVTVPISNM
jgi:hypothetical protein